jgi:hypothetical protein
MADMMETRRRRQRSPLPWHPAVLPPPGFRLEHDGVTFEAVKAGPHTGTTYSNVWLVTWRTHCIDCGAELTTMSTAKGWEQLHAKRCKPCVTRLNKG